MKNTIYLLSYLATFNAALAASFTLEPAIAGWNIRTTNYVLQVATNGFRYGFVRPEGAIIAPAHTLNGIEFGGSPVTHAWLKLSNGRCVVFDAENEQGESGIIEIEPALSYARFSIVSPSTGRILARTGGIGPAFGLGDHWAMPSRKTPATTEVTGFVDEEMSAHHRSGSRLVSNFVIAPGAGIAMVNIEPNPKVVRVTDTECAQGVASADTMPALYYFIGAPEQIYRDFLDARNRHGYRVYRPKYEWFGVGWEAFGALAWETNQKTVTENVNQYLELGYPLSWMVVGSGFWPRHDPRLHATTSFGMWDTNLYPDPRGLIRQFQSKGLKFIVGLRIAFIVDGPYTAEGLSKGYFLKENGAPKVYQISFPKSPIYLLDTANRQALSWYLDLCQMWLAYGIDGFKEDLFGYGKYVFTDDKLDPVNAALMDMGVYIMGRNGYLGSPMDLHRYNDFNWNQNQDRGPINGLAFAYSGFPYVYPDIVGGTMTLKSLPPLSDPKLKRYFMRYAQYAAVNPSMAVGYGPWNFKDPQVDQVMLEAAQLHARLHPFIFSAALEAFETGFPHCFTPLPLKWPHDPEVYQLENTTRRGYQWLIGASLMAVPLYGNDCATAETRDIYLPKGRWMDWDSGKSFEGPRTLKSYGLPHGKTPLFIGGTGIVVERPLTTKDLVASVYPVSPAGSRLRFIHPDGRSLSRIDNRADFAGNGAISVRDLTDDKPVPFQRVDRTGAIQFQIVAGHDYAVEQGK